MFKKPSNTDIAWTAGILEGEAYFETSQLRIVVQMTDLDVLEKLQNIWGGTISNPINRSDNWKTSWKWQLNGLNVSTMLFNIKPYMSKRRSEAIDKQLKIWFDRIVKKGDFENKKSGALYDHKVGGMSISAAAKKNGISYQTLANMLS